MTSKNGNLNLPGSVLVLVSLVLMALFGPFLAGDFVPSGPAKTAFFSPLGLVTYFVLVLFGTISAALTIELVCRRRSDVQSGEEWFRRGWRRVAMFVVGFLAAGASLLVILLGNG